MPGGVHVRARVGDGRDLLGRRAPAAGELEVLLLHAEQPGEDLRPLALVGDLGLQRLVDGVWDEPDAGGRSCG